MIDSISELLTDSISNPIFLPKSIQLVYLSEINYQESNTKKVKGFALLNAPVINRRINCNQVSIM